MSANSINNKIADPRDQDTESLENFPNFDDIAPHAVRTALEAITSPQKRHSNLHIARRNDIVSIHLPRSSSLPGISKRIFDISAAGCALVVLAPLMLMIMLLIRCDGGPAFFGHRRLGKNGKSFACFKFRSMVMNANHVLEDHLAHNPDAYQEWHTDYKLRDDPRVTRIGRFLRSTSLDELPQLINILKGEMSVVGPRPIVAAESVKYNHDIALYYLVRPGLTGLWQVSGRSEISYMQRVALDSHYVRNWSFLRDLAIIFKTVPALVKRTGAY